MRAIIRIQRGGNPQTLFKICLKCISNNIHRFAAAYNSSTEVERLDFDILQNAASKDLIQMVSEVDNIRNEYLPLLLNRHLKDLDINLMKYIDPERILERLWEIGHGLKCVRLKGQSEYQEKKLRDKGLPMPSAWSERQLMELALLIASVEKLTLCCTKCTNRVLKVIADNCPFLRVLHLTSCEVTDEGIISLCKKDINGCYIKNVQLEELDIFYTNASKRAVYFCLSYFPCLKTLLWQDLEALIYWKHKGDISIRLPQYNLTRLGIGCARSFRWREENMADVITMLSLVCPKVTNFVCLRLTSQTELDACKAFTHLASVNLQMDEVQKLDVFPFLAARGNILEYLWLSGCRLSVEWIAKYCPNLHTLDLTSIEFLPFKPGTSHTMELSSLRVTNPSFIEGGISAADFSLRFIIAASKNLKKLYLFQCTVSFDELIDAVVAAELCSKLRELWFNHSGSVSADRIIKFISWAPHLELLSVAGDGMPDNMYPVLKSLLQEVKPKSILRWAI